MKSQRNLFHVEGGSISSEVATTIDHIKQLMSLTAELVPKSDDVKTEEIGDMVDSEMQLTSKAIEQAANKIQVGICLLRTLSGG